MYWLLACVILAIVLAVGIWFLQRFYAKATLESALVRTGMGGRRVLTDGGCLVLPILHQAQRVSMQTSTVTVARTGKDAVLTADPLRADIAMKFELRVAARPDSIATAAQAFGHRIARGGEAFEEALAGPLADAIQTAAAVRELNNIHLERGAFTAEVAGEVAERAARLGLELVTAALVSVDQSNFAHRDENNTFNARGMRRVAEMIAEERKARIAVETSTEVAVREHRLSQHQRQIELQRAEREAEIAQQEHLARLEAEAESRSAQARAEARRASETMRIQQEQETKAAQVAQDEALRKAEMRALLELEEAKIANDIRLAEARAKEAQAKAAEEEARAQVILAAENVQAQKERAITLREREIAKLKQERDIELEDARVKSDVSTLLARAQADASARTATANAEKAAMEAEAAGRAALNSAENTLSEAVIRMRLEERKLDKMPEIMTQMMKPVEKIDSIRINQIGGIGGGGGDGGTGVDGAFGAAMDQILGMAVRLPAMKQMGEEIGLDFDVPTAGRTADYANRIKAKDEPKPQE
ncbi:flotillin domain-containing protein [Aestuariivita boseongensis]|uniref:flotillin domain-containing protein n=1 Tax=Aestuariivita boseongensis TaxID=1470562 RepID=UPI00067FB18E|nr:flotillin domain-containing protein [Aestuariivita boseongensis]